MRVLILTMRFVAGHYKSNVYVLVREKKTTQDLVKDWIN